MGSKDSARDDPPERSRASFALAAVLVLLAAAGLRLVALESRPMHHDEAINSLKVALLLERGTYRYDPKALHGPTLPYLTLPAVWASGARTYAETDEKTYRSVTVILGLGLVALTFVLRRGVGAGAALSAALLCALSPAMVFYSRYYVHEMPLAFFTFAAVVSGWRYFRTRGRGRLAWAFAAALGASLGLMHATKETFVIACVAMGIGLAFAGPERPVRRLPDRFRSLASDVRGGHVLVAVASGTLLSILFFSSFLTHPGGPIDSITAFGSYLTLGTDTGSEHHHPWYWYLGLLLHHQRAGGPIFSEVTIVALAAVGLVGAVSGRGVDARHLPLARFFAGYTIALIVIYSAIPYKTPWCMLTFLHGMIVLAGIGVVVSWRCARRPAVRTVVVVLLVGLAELSRQTYLVNFRFQGDERSPYVYSQSMSDVRRMATLVEELASLPDPVRRVRTYVLVWLDNASTAFYLRRVPNVRYATSRSIPEALDAEIVLAYEETRPVLDGMLDGEYHVERFQLRPNRWRLLYVRQALWDAYRRSRELGLDAAE